MRRVMLIQAFSADSALKVLNDIHVSTAPDIVVLPEYCLSLERLPDLTYISSQLRKTRFITAVKDDNSIEPGKVTRRNCAIQCLAGETTRIYNKISPDSESHPYEEDRSDPNKDNFNSQSRNLFVAVCNDKSLVWQVKPLPSLVIIPAKDSASDYPISPPESFTGDVIFVNGHCAADVPSYWYCANMGKRASGLVEPRLMFDVEEEGVKEIEIG